MKDVMREETTETGNINSLQLRAIKE